MKEGQSATEIQAQHDFDWFLFQYTSNYLPTNDPPKQDVHVLNNKIVLTILQFLNYPSAALTVLPIGLDVVNDKLEFDWNFSV